MAKNSQPNEEQKSLISKTCKENIDLVIGDSMVKNIDNIELTRAATKKLFGVRITTKFEEHSKEVHSYDSA